jgi:lysyl-tRNA synthetase class I
MVEKPISIILMKCDNETLITKVISSKDNMKSSRHVKRQLKSVRKLRSSLVIALDYIPITENLTDQFTKGLSRSVINNVKVHLGPLVDFG